MKKLSLISCLLSFLFILPGWRNYQTNSEIYDHPPAEMTVPVNSAVVLDKSGKIVCLVNLLKHSDLVPNFATLSTKIIADLTSEPQQKTTTITQKLNFSPCTDEYLTHLKYIATNNIVPNSGRSPIHKSSWSGYVTSGVAVCTSGVGIYLAMNDTKNTPTAGAVASANMSIGFFLLSNGSYKETKILEKKLSTTFDKLLYDNLISSELADIEDIEKDIRKLRKDMKIFIAATIGTFCYAATELLTVIYEHIND